MNVAFNHPVARLRAESCLWLAAVLLAGMVAGCGRNEVRVYRAPKEIAAVPPAESDPAQTGAHEEPREETLPPQVHWTLPSGWQERPLSSMRVASFAIEGKEGQRAEVAIVPLPGVTGRELDLVNMWREQVQLEPVAEAALASQAESVPVGTGQGKLFNMVSEKPVGEGKTPTRILVAMLEKEGTSWFFKMMGDDALVREQRPIFAQFLKSIAFEPAAASARLTKRPQPMSTNAKQVPRENSTKPLWVVPSGWQEATAGPMLAAKFVVPGSGDARAEVNIGMAGGSALANINRWRGQLSLGPLTDADLEKQVQSLDVLGGKAMLVDMTGTDARRASKTRLLGAIVPQGEQTWFYKLMGNEQVVEREKESFVKFVETVRYH